ncbi:hypothetical protein EDB89DRAFT_1903787 [Lactarius sanguifluus]|nr:hypothetical protein EDB89DRAFT_1903787 [Lactarius sanguifluus]
MSRELGFSSFTGSATRGGGSRNRPDHANSHYFRSSRGGRGGASARPGRDTASEVNIKQGLDTSKIIETIPQPTRASAPEDLPIENVKYVASYNWVDTDKPTIVVPGSPAIWTGHALPFTLQPDDGSVFVDQNSARLSEYPMLPLFAAADAIHGPKTTASPVDWPTVDVITDRNGLRKLLRWLNPSPGREVRDFRIDIQLVGTKTLMLGRWEGRSREPPSGRTYGFGFEDATTRAAPGCPPSGHHRAITYDMLGVKMVVRFEVDACLPTATSSVPKTTPASVDDLADALGGMNIKHRTPATTKTTSSSSPVIDIVRAGTQVPQEALVELTSRSAYFLDQLDWNELYPQLALSQTPALHIGVHERGVFTQLHEWQLDGRPPRTGTRVTSDAAAAAKAKAPDISAQRRETGAQIVRLARLFEIVQEVAIARGAGPAGSFSLVCEGGELRVYARKRDAGAKSCLPRDVVARFEAHTQT